MMIEACTGRQVEPGGLPMNVGCVVSNVGTVIAITDAVCQGIPFIERLTTVTGDCIKEPKNLRLRIGTTFQEVIDYCGGFTEKPDRLIAGGPMMGSPSISSMYRLPKVRPVSWHSLRKMPGRRRISVYPLRPLRRSMSDGPRSESAQHLLVLPGLG